MDCLMYYHIASSATCKQVLAAVRGMSDVPYHGANIIKFKKDKPSAVTGTDMYRFLLQIISDKDFDKDDEILMFYWSANMAGVWKCKVSSYSDFRIEHTDMQYLDISLGSKLGLID